MDEADDTVFKWVSYGAVMCLWCGAMYIGVGSDTHELEHKPGCQRNSGYSPIAPELRQPPQEPPR